MADIPKPSFIDQQRKKLQELPDDELEILHDTYPSNFAVKSEWERRMKEKKEKEKEKQKGR
jgi:hypothetical protein